ncbi:MAG: orotate phosphoribosyltransferase [Thermoanaerobaculia bacterium]
MKNVELHLAETGALLSGHFRLSSGLHSPQYVQCARLLEEPARADELGERLAALIAPMRPDRIVAPALGGLIIGFTTARSLGLPMIFTERKEGAMSLRRGFEVRRGERVVIVEDVVTTGKSTAETAAVVRLLGAEVVGYGSILSRSGRDNPFEEPYVYLMKLEIETWPEDRCPLCARGVSVDAPGSRFGEERV